MSANITATTGHEIQVFAMFPTDPKRASWDWVHCLTFQPDALIQLNFSPKPYKWIRYATGVVVGAEGHLSFRPDDPDDVMEYDDDLRLESAVLYYHTTEAEKRRMFPADPDVGRTNVTSSDATTRRANFRNDIVVRDGALCVLTGLPARVCDAAHLLPHSKGDQYIDTYTQRRSRDVENDIVHEIDDVRNGILLNKIAHATLGEIIAFLVTPNFAMTTMDVDPTLQPMEKRCTAHLFVPNQPGYFGGNIPPGSPVRMPPTANKWPPGILFDAVYANAILHHFAPQSMHDTLKQWKSTFYPRGIASAAQASHQAIIDGQAAEAERKNKQDRSRDERAARHAGWRMNQDRADFFDYLMIMPYILMKPEEVEASWRKAAEERAERERSRLEDKVEGWAKEVANACQ